VANQQPFDRESDVLCVHNHEVCEVAALTYRTQRAVWRTPGVFQAPGRRTAAEGRRCRRRRWVSADSTVDLLRLPETSKSRRPRDSRRPSSRQSAIVVHGVKFTARTQRPGVPAESSIYNHHNTLITTTRQWRIQSEVRLGWTNPPRVRHHCINKKASMS